MSDITVVIPIYNVEKYLRKCVDSVEKQTYKNFEVILVDDGSTVQAVNCATRWQKKTIISGLYTKKTEVSAAPETPELKVVIQSTLCFWTVMITFIPNC